MASDPLITTEYWTNIQITPQDIEFLHTYLFEHEVPLTARELVSVFVNERERVEKLAVQHIFAHRQQEAAAGCLRHSTCSQSCTAAPHRSASTVSRFEWRLSLSFKNSWQQVRAPMAACPMELRSC